MLSFCTQLFLFFVTMLYHLSSWSSYRHKWTDPCFVRNAQIKCLCVFDGWKGWGCLEVKGIQRLVNTKIEGHIRTFPLYDWDLGLEPTSAHLPSQERSQAQKLRQMLYKQRNAFNFYKNAGIQISRLQSIKAYLQGRQIFAEPSCFRTPVLWQSLPTWWKLLILRKLTEV